MGNENLQPPGLFGKVGNFLTSAHSFGDPRETFRRNTPQGLLDEFSEEEQIRRGELLQQKFRTPGSRSAVRDTFRNDLAGELSQKAAVEQRQQFDQAVEGHQALLPGQKIIAQRLPFEDAVAFVQDALKPANVAGGTGRYAGTEEVARSAPTSVQELEAAGIDPTSEQGQIELAGAPSREVKDTMQLINAEGEVVQALRTPQGLFTQGVDAEGNPELKSFDPAGFREATAAELGTTEGESVRSQKIADAMRLNPNLDERLVVGIVDNQISVRQDPETGRNFIVDPFTNEQVPVTTLGPNGEERQAPDLSGTPSVKEGTNTEATTGIGGSFRRLGNLISDPLGFGSLSERTAVAETELNNFNQFAKLRLADDATEGRRSNMVIEMLDSLTANPNSILQGADSARNQLTAMKRAIRQVRDANMSIVEDSFNNKPSKVSQAESAVRSMNGLLLDVDELIDGFGDQSAPDSPAPDGLSEDEWRVMSPEERALWQN